MGGSQPILNLIQCSFATNYATAEPKMYDWGGKRRGLMRLGSDDTGTHVVSDTEGCFKGGNNTDSLHQPVRGIFAPT